MTFTHYLDLDCGNCGWGAEFAEEGVFSLAVRLPYCCPEPDHTVNVKCDPRWEYTPGRGVRFTTGRTCGDQYGAVVEQEGLCGMAEYNPEPPKSADHAVYFISELRPTGPRRGAVTYINELEVDTEAGWKAKIPNFEASQCSTEVILMGAATPEFPVGVLVRTGINDESPPPHNHPVKHHIRVRCMGCPYDKTYTADVHSLAVRLPFCCALCSQAAIVWTDTPKYEPGRGVCYHEGTGLVLDPTFTDTEAIVFYTHSPDTPEEAIYFVSELKVRDATTEGFKIDVSGFPENLFVNALSHWTTSPHLESEPASGEVVLLDEEPTEIPVHVSVGTVNKPVPTRCSMCHRHM